MKIQLVLCFTMFILLGATSSLKVSCPFDYLYQFGDGVTDIGNTKYVLPWGQIAPSTHPPYGIDYPGHPTGRWSNGRVDFDWASADFGLPNIVPYLGMNVSATNDGVIFSVARSPVLNIPFFEEKGIDIPPYAHFPLDTQITWFKTYLKYAVCSTKQDCKKRLQNSLVLFSDVHGNDVGYALTQGKTIEQVQSYVPSIIEATIKNARELIKMGAGRVVIAGNAPLGCFPYILTELASDDPTAYDELGCLKSVNEFIQSRNAQLEKAVENLQSEFPDTPIFFGDVYEGTLYIIKQSTVFGPDGVNRALKACCGIGGKYNYDKNRFCGSPGADVCPNRDEYVFWDGYHSTQQGYRRVEQHVIPGAYVILQCKTDLIASE